MAQAALPIASAGLSLFQGYASIKQGRAERNAYAAEANAREQEARLIDLQTRQQATNRLEELNGNLAAIEAIRASRNLATDSTTGRAVSKAYAAESRDAIDAERLSGMIAARQKRIGAASARVAGSNALFQGYVKAAGNLFDAAAGARKAFG